MPPAPPVMFGTRPSPSGAGAPASQRAKSSAPAKLRGVWHSPQWPGPSTRYWPRGDRRVRPRRASTAGAVGQEGELPEADAAADAEGEAQARARAPARRPPAGCARKARRVGDVLRAASGRRRRRGRPGRGAARPARPRAAWRWRSRPRSSRRCRPPGRWRCSAPRSRRRRSSSTRPPPSFSRSSPSAFAAAWQEAQPPAQNTGLAARGVARRQRGQLGRRTARAARSASQKAAAPSERRARRARRAAAASATASVVSAEGLVAGLAVAEDRLDRRLEGRLVGRPVLAGGLPRRRDVGLELGERRLEPGRVLPDLRRGVAAGRIDAALGEEAAVGVRGGRPGRGSPPCRPPGCRGSRP